MLSVANNQLGSIPYSANSYLWFLNASHNQLTSFNLSIQNSLTYVDLSYNNILSEVLDPPNHSDLGLLTNLGYLDLQHNKLTTIGSIATIAASQKGGALETLYLACNPQFKCGDLSNGDLSLFDGKKYPYARTSACSEYNTNTQKWTPLTNPTCSQVSVHQ